MRTRWFGLGVVLAVGFALASCGESDGNKKGSDDSDSNDEGGSSPGAGGGGRSGAGQSGGGSGGIAVPEPVECGSSLCMPRPTLPTFPAIAACCVDATEGTCGLDTALLASFGGEPTRPTVEADGTALRYTFRINQECMDETCTPGETVTFVSQADGSVMSAP